MAQSNDLVMRHGVGGGGGGGAGVGEASLTLGVDTGVSVGCGRFGGYSTIKPIFH